MERVLSTDGFLIISTHGEAYLGELTPDQQAQFRAGQAVVKDHRICRDEPMRRLRL